MSFVQDQMKHLEEKLKIEFVPGHFLGEKAVKLTSFSACHIERRGICDAGVAQHGGRLFFFRVRW